MERLGRWLREQGLSAFLDRWYLSPGVAWPQALERALGSCRAVAICVGPGEMGAWQQKESFLALERQGRDGFPVIPVLLPGSELPLGFLRQNTWIDLRHNLDDLIQLTILKKSILREPPGPDLREELGAQVSAICPYLGLRAFREEDAALFFGREDFSATLLERVLSATHVTVIGPSGSGKSSLVQAGLLPLLRRERPPRPTWDAVTCRPGQQPFHRVATALVTAWDADLPETDQFIQAEKLGNELTTGTVSLARAFEFFLDKSGGTDRVLLVVDQFEELFTLTPPAERSRFVQSLLEATDPGRVTAVLTLRGDFYNHAIAIDRDLSQRIAGGIVNLGPMRRDELRRTIEKPAETVGLVFEAGLVDRILDHVEGEPGNLPLLEFALTELWARRRGNRLEHDQYNTLGQVDGAIGKRAADVFQGLSSDTQKDARSLMTRLVRVVAASEDSSDTRQRVSLKELGEGARIAMKAFADARLLVVGRDEATNEETVELAHEALIRSWPEMREILDNDRRFLLWRQRLDLLLDEWQRSNRDEALLLRAAQLVEAKRLARDRGKDLNKAEHEFVVTSERKARQPRRWAVAISFAAGVAAVAAGLWFVWTRTDAYQIRAIRADVPALVARSEGWLESNEVVRLLRVLALIGYEGEAQAAASAIRNVPERVRTLSLMAQALAKAGRMPVAMNAMVDARAAARAIPDAYDRSAAFSTVAVALARAGAQKEAMDAAATARSNAFAITELTHRARALVAACVAHLAAGETGEAEKDLASALASARKIKDAGDRSEALSTLAFGFVKAGRRAEAAATLADAEASVMQITDSPTRDARLLTVKNARDLYLGKLQETGEPVNALAEARTAIREAREPATLATAIHGALSMSGSSNDAVQLAFEAYAIVRKIDDRYQRSLILVKIGETLVRAGRKGDAVKPLEEARAIGSDLRDAQERSFLLSWIVIGLAEADQPDAARMALKEARTAAMQVSDPGEELNALLRVLDAASALGDVREVKQAATDVVKIADEMRQPFTQSSVRMSAAEALARAHVYREARELVAKADVVDQLKIYRVVLAGYASRRDPKLSSQLGLVERVGSRRSQESVEAEDPLEEYPLLRSRATRRSVLLPWR